MTTFYKLKNMNYQWSTQNRPYALVFRIPRGNL